MRLFGSRAISSVCETPGFASPLYSRFAFIEAKLRFFRYKG